MTKKAKLFKGLSKQELNNKLEEIELELVKLNAQVSTGTAIKNPSQISNAKKNIARIKTLLKAKT